MSLTRTSGSTSTTSTMTPAPPPPLSAGIPRGSLLDMDNPSSDNEEEENGEANNEMDRAEGDTFRDDSGSNAGSESELGEDDDIPDDDSRLTKREAARLFQKSDLYRLSRMLRDIDTGLPHKIRHYQNAVQLKEKRSEKLIIALTKENQDLKKKLRFFDNQNRILAHEMSQLNNSSREEKRKFNSLLVSERKFRREVKQLRQELETVKDKSKAIIDMIQLLSNIQCSDITNTDTELIVTVKQADRRYTHEYQLIFETTESDSHSSLTYVPIWNENAENELIKVLPEYLTKKLLIPTNAVPLLAKEIGKFLK